MNSGIDLQDRVLNALDTVRPYLQMDGGDVELVEIVDGEVRVRLTGTCSNCNMSTMTMKAGLEEGIKKAVPEIQRVIAV